MTRKLIILLGVLALALLATLSGCGKTSAPPTTPASAPVTQKPTSISITYVKSPLNVPSIIEKKMSSFEKEFAKDNITVTFPEITVGSKQTEAMAAGSLDFAHCLGGTSAILAAANGVDLKIIAIYSRAPKAFVVLTKSDTIQKITDLKGKKIAGPKGTILHQLILAALAKNGMKPDDIEFISMDLPSSSAALMNGSVDAALSAGPDAVRAEKAGARVLTTGEGLVEATIVTAVRGDFLQKHPELVKRFLSVHNAALSDINVNIEEALKMTAAETGLTIEAVKQMYPWYDFDATIKPSDIQELKRTQDFLIQNGMLKKSI
ncbi:MAG TPA: NrtA/SsuA/CpmA family ABC transporter substrate-binding protein, partial [Negativicutes bacterium]|nr:NrtA/SsuA/CpmA family ABC transporter substrate-binding protein [Negativicutes bacterium]